VLEELLNALWRGGRGDILRVIIRIFEKEFCALRDPMSEFAAEDPGVVDSRLLTGTLAVALAVCSRRTGWPANIPGGGGNSNERERE
tara:strand:- start:2271 stop:2531 length:261 start_codon:yes stop_codon:yes gene_type:complete